MIAASCPSLDVTVSGVSQIESACSTDACQVRRGGLTQMHGRIIVWGGGRIA